jgi:uncharacterized membrane protein YkvA (DUF1232 family)
LFKESIINFITIWQRWAKRLKAEIYALYLAYKDPRTPWYARVFAVVVVGYAFSPIDLIPDFIPVLGYLDDLVLLPIGVGLTIKMIPPEVLIECRQQAQTKMSGNEPVNWTAAVVIITIWLLLAGTVVFWLHPHL